MTFIVRHYLAILIVILTCTIICPSITFSQKVATSSKFVSELPYSEIVDLVRSKTFEQISSYLRSKGGVLRDSITDLLKDGKPYPFVQQNIFVFNNGESKWNASLTTGGYYSYHLGLSIKTYQKSVFDGYFQKMDYKCKQNGYPRYYLDINTVPSDHRFKSISVYFDDWSDQNPPFYLIDFEYNNGID